ncbi:histidine kinase [Cryobacterium sp.]|uniref:histidine kinase n=1 Tax=Cryobacterium sp. TaxID=1926290 RepID=UPI00262E57F0|nr:histidine kinase [Cryobacterium sp.]MCU1446844.1 sensor histidine kinase [Cryobacterium sp.]
MVRAAAPPGSPGTATRADRCGVLLLATVAVAALALDADWTDLVDSYTVTNVVFGLAFGVSGGLIAWSRPTNGVGWIFLAGAVGHLVTAAAGVVMFYGIESGWPEVGSRMLASVYIVAWQVGIAGLFPLALLLFPDGRLPSPRWRPLAWLIVLSMLFQMTTGVVSRDPSGPPRAQTSILSVGLVLPTIVEAAGGIVASGVFVACIVSLVLRYRRGDEQTRMQLLWVILAIVILGVVNGQRFVTGNGPILFLLTSVLIPLSIAIAIVRHGLLDIRLVLSRTLLYVLAVSTLVAVYAGLVAGLSLVVPAAFGRTVAIGAAIVVALGFNPLRLYLRRLIDRAFYGTRADPTATMVCLGEGLRSTGDLGDVIEHARLALRMPYLALVPALGDRIYESGMPPAEGNTRPAGTDGRPGGPHTEVPLTYRDRVVGRLLVGLRRGERVLHEDDRRAIALIAAPLAVALHAVGLTEQVQAARTAVVEAREEERVLLQRELHDGLGPLLTSAALQADATSNILRTDPDTAEQLLRTVRETVRQALKDVRRVVYGLRPIELDELGLVDALRQRTRQPVIVGERTIEFVVRAEALPPLTPAVELAAFRIAMEAVSNVLRHSEATRCVITVSASDETLALTVTDNGIAGNGIAGNGGTSTPGDAGVGLRSMAERAEELGGSATGGPAPSGWRVRLEIPMPPPA